MIKFLKDIFTERDGTSYCIGRFIGIVAAGEMVIKFANLLSVDYVGFATGIAAIIASVAAKNYSEK